jgi:D-glycero-D-manno-heptose 1,7-bisphosphate phosphatase
MGSATAVFLDRDGVINREVGYLYRIEDFEFVPGAVGAMQRLVDAGCEIVLVTNQAGIARGYYDEAQYQVLTRHIRHQLALSGVTLLDILHCPHHPKGVVQRFAIECECRKPKPGMILKAAAVHGLDLARSALVGDKLSDVQAGRAAGVGTNVLVNSGHPLTAEDLRQHDSPVFADLAAFADWWLLHRAVAESSRQV